MAGSQKLSPYSTTNPPPTHIDITVGSQKPDPDRTIRVHHADTYPLVVWYWLGCLIFLASIINFTSLALTHLRSKRLRRQLAQSSNPVTKQEPPKLRGSINLLRLPKALTDTFRALSFRWTIPVGRSYSLNFAEVLVMAMHIALCLTLSFINSTSTKGVKFDPHYYANIVGHIVALHFPLIVALGMKNNIISFLTGISFDKLLHLHTILSRSLVVLIAIHAGGRGQLGFSGKTALTVPAIQSGPLAGVAIALLSIISIRPIRDRAYGFFLVVHFFLACIAILAAYFHANYLDWGKFVWPGILLWALDRFIRIFRMVFNTLIKKKNSSQSQVIPNPNVDLLSTHFLRLTIPKPHFFHWRPGQCAYLTFTNMFTSPLEAHPFTIAAVDDKSKNICELRFFIRVREGLTKRLLDSVEGNGVVKVLLDGPYGTPPLMVGYDSVMLIAGGSGISFTLPLFVDLIQRSKAQGTACRRLTFAWAIRDLEHITWIQSELLNALHDTPTNLILNIHIFTTGTNTTDLQDIIKDSSSDDTSESEIEKSRNENSSSSDHSQKQNSNTASESSPLQDILASPVVKVHQGRPDLDKLIKEEVGLTRDTMSVNVCGTQGLASAVRKAIRHPHMMDILKGGPSISLHVESFSGN